VTHDPRPAAHRPRPTPARPDAGSDAAASPLPAPGREGKDAALVQAMFDRVAPRYDLANAALSLGQDAHWRRVTALAARPRGARALDVAAGPGNVARELVARGAEHVTALDLSFNMLAAGARRGEPHLTWVNGDAMRLPFPDASFDVVTISFGLRNVPDPELALREFGRVTRPGGPAGRVRVRRPDLASFRRLYRRYLVGLLPEVARVVSSSPRGVPLPRRLDPRLAGPPGDRRMDRGRRVPRGAGQGPRRRDRRRAPGVQGVNLPGCRIGRWVAGLLLLALALAGCDRSASPEDELRTATERTLSEDVGFTLSARADRASLDALGEGAGEAAAFLATFQLTGVREADGAYALVVDIGGTAPLFEVRGGGQEPLLLRTGLGALLGAEGDPATSLGPRLDALGIDGEPRQAMVAGFAGDWIAITDADDVGDLAGPALAGEEPEAGADASAGTGDPFDLGRLFAALEVRSARDVGDVRRFAVQLDAQGWLGTALGGATDGSEVVELPASVPGSVTVRDGLVHEVRLELAEGTEGAESADGQPGRVELVLALHDHGEVAEIEPAVPVVEVTTAELVELIAVLDGQLG
jgi:demethylmenaquinone methyltransferase / 2-methoxy-6-polyprenyl-1,4-benzoquinol methylase